MNDSARFTDRTIRQSTLAAVLRSGGADRLGVVRQVGLYPAGYDAAARRLTDDMEALELAGLSASRGKSYSACAQMVDVNDQLSETIHAAAREVGRGFIYERPLRLAVHKLTGREIGRLRSAPKAVVVSSAAGRAVECCERALTSGYAIRYLKDGWEGDLLPQAFVMGGGRVQIVATTSTGRWLCELGEHVNTRVGKIARLRYELRQIPAATVGMPQALGRRAGKGGFVQIGPDVLSYAWSLAQIAANAQAVTISDAIRHIGGKPGDVRAAAEIINCTHVDGAYLGYVEVDGLGRIKYEPEAWHALFLEGWPLTPREARAVCAALALHGADDDLAEFEAVTGVRGRVLAVGEARENNGQLCLAA